MGQGRIDVLTLVPYPLGIAPGQRYRLEQWAPLLESHGVHLHFEPFLSSRAMSFLYRPGLAFSKAIEIARGWTRRARLLPALSRYSAAVVFREAGLLGSTWLETRVGSRLPLVYDFDDAIYLPTVSDANRWASFMKSTRKPERIARIARHVTVGNEVLAQAARRWNEAVTVIPSTIDTDEYKVVSRPDNPRPVVGWTGSGTTAPYLESLVPALRALREKVDFKLRVIGAEPPMPGLDVEYVEWRAETEAADLRVLDVGLMPLPDDDWARGKCGMKALQYMGLGIPPVVSPIGANTTIVEHSVTGFHASAQGDWTSAVQALLQDRDLRRRIGTAARRTVEERYSARVHAPRLAQVITSVLGARRTEG